METQLASFKNLTLSVELGDTNIGILRSDKKTLLIDSGNSQSIATQLLNSELANNRQIVGIVNTHAHSDHTTCNSFFLEKTGCRLFASEGEAGLLLLPETQTAFLCGGYPLQQIRTPYLEGLKSHATDILLPGSEFPFSEFDVKTVSLKGHSFDDVGVFVAEESSTPFLFVGDAIFGKSLLYTHFVPFIYDVKSFKASLQKIKEIAMQMLQVKKSLTVIPSHSTILRASIQDKDASCYENLFSVIEENQNRVSAIEEVLLKICNVPRTFESCMRELAKDKALNFSFTSYLLVGHTVRSFLSYLSEAKKINCFMEENSLFFEA